MKKTIVVLSILLLLITAAPLLADSITPGSVTGSLAGVGSTMTVTKTVTVNAGTVTTSPVDVFFLADTTGSMYGAIGAVAASASSILSGTVGLGDVQWAVGEYKDFGDAYVYRLNQAMTANQTLAQNGIGAWVADGGGDYPEAQLFALHNLATDPGTGWRPGSARILVWMGDSEGHDPSGGIGLATAINDLQTNHIKVEAVDMNCLNCTYEQPHHQASEIAAATGGTYYAGINTASIVATIQAAITTAVTTYSNVSLDFSEAGPHVTVASTPGSYTGAFDRSIDRTFSFDVTFTGASVGTDDFHIYATVDGARVATESDHLTVGAVPEPGSILLFGTVLLGVAGAIRRRMR